MLKCPNCHKIMEDGAKFCSECATELLLVEELEEKIPEEQPPAVTDEAAQSEAVQSEEVAKSPAKPQKHSRKGVFLSMLLAIFAVVAMFVFYEELGFDTPERNTNNAILYVKDGELYFNDFSEKGEIQISKNFAGAVDTPEKILDTVKISDDGKTVFYPDRAGAGTNGYSLYCTKPYSDELPIKLGNGVVWYDIDSKGTVVYYITADNVLYRHDLKEKTKIAKDVSSAAMSRDGKRAVYYAKDALYEIIGTTPSKKIASDVTEYRTDNEIKIVYYKNDKGFFRYDSATSQAIGTADASMMASGGVNLVFKDEEALYVATQIGKYELDCVWTTAYFWFSDSGNALYYAEPLDGQTTCFDVYRVQIEDGKPQTAVLCEADVSCVLDVNDTSAICMKDMRGSVGDLYIAGICCGYDVSFMIAQSSSDEISFLADCDENGAGTLTVFDGKKTATVRADVSGVAYTDQDELIFLCDVRNGKGDLYRVVNGEAKLICEGASILLSLD